jgi:hypothetical protein
MKCMQSAYVKQYISIEAQSAISKPINLKSIFQNKAIAAVIFRADSKIIRLASKSRCFVAVNGESIESGLESLSWSIVKHRLFVCWEFYGFAARQYCDNWHGRDDVVVFRGELRDFRGCFKSISRIETWSRFRAWVQSPHRYSVLPDDLLAVIYDSTHLVLAVLSNLSICIWFYLIEANSLDDV